jgi:hypothetical protein
MCRGDLFRFLTATAAVLSPVERSVAVRGELDEDKGGAVARLETLAKRLHASLVEEKNDARPG